MICRIALATVLLVVHPLLVGCSSPRGVVGGPTPTAVDFDLIEIVLVDLMDFTEFHPATSRDGKRSRIVLDAKTTGYDGFISDDQLNGESYPERDKLVPADISADLRRRNPERPISLSGFKPNNPNILVEELSDIDDPMRRASFGEKYPDARGYVQAWLPGYSSDGMTAVVRLWFGPTAHGATATYMLVKQNDRWMVKWRKVAYYA